MVNNRTYIDPEGMRASADRIGPLLSDLSSFHRVSAITTNSGNFPAAHWLDTMLVKRGDALFQHAQSVDLVCRDIKSGLHQVVTDFENTDDSNANDLDRTVSHDVNVIRKHAWGHTKESQDTNPDS
jgi:hypothetical protein